MGQTTLQNVPYMDYKLLVLMSFEVTTVASMDSQEPPAVMMATCWFLNEVDGTCLLPYKVHFEGAKFDRGWD